MPEHCATRDAVQAAVIGEMKLWRGALMACPADRYDLWFRTAFFVDKF